MHCKRSGPARSLPIRTASGSVLTDRSSYAPKLSGLIDSSEVAPPMEKTASPSAARRRSDYFFWMSLLLLAVVLVAFAPTLYLRSISDLQSLPIRLHIHGAVLTSWFVWFVVQTSAVRSGQIATHRKLGVVGAIIGAACVFAGPLATIGSVRKLRSAGLEWDTDMSLYPHLGIEGMPMEQFAKQLVFGNFASIVVFAGLLICAILYRAHGPTHKRLMLLASISIIGPALARISRWEGLGGEDGAFIPVAFIGLMLTLFAHDLMTSRRVLRASWTGVLAIILIFAVSVMIATTSVGSAVVRSMA